MSCRGVGIIIDLEESDPLPYYIIKVWSPSLVDPITVTALEGVQRHFTKRLVRFDSLSYAERLTQSNLQSLEHRRLMSDPGASFEGGWGGRRPPPPPRKRKKKKKEEKKEKKKKKKKEKKEKRNYE